MVWLPIVRRLKPRRYDRVFIDETQDLDPAQIELVLRSVAPKGRITAVGDPRQAIYGFRGADEHAMPKVIERLNAQTLPLSVCYRCARSIVREAQTIVPEIESAPEAVEGSVQRVNKDEIQDAAPGDFILSRTNAPLIGLCMGFLAEGRPANIEGRDVGESLTSFVRKSRAKDVEALRDYTHAWAHEEYVRLAATDRNERAIQTVGDRRDCIMAIISGAKSIDEVLDRIKELFVDRDDSDMIMLSSTHKAKGLERDRVWLLEGTYRWAPGIEEDNLYYVAVTRARRTLFLVDGFGLKRNEDEHR